MRVYLVAKPQIGWTEFFQFEKDETVKSCHSDAIRDSELLVEFAGRLCYLSYGKGRKTTSAFIANLIASGHHSVLEHANYTIFITGISRSCSHELVRHRHFSYSQLSQRYVDESQAAMIMPEAIQGSGDDTFERAIATARTAYSVLVSTLEMKFHDIADATMRRKMARTAARAVLPNAVETKIAVTGNVRAWRQFIQTREIPQADPEIRNLARMIREKLTAESTMLFGDLKPCESI